MDPLTHCLTTALATYRLDLPRRRFWTMVALAEFSDVDVLFERAGGWAHLLYHRGITHSILGFLGQTLLLALLLHRWDPGPFLRRFGHYAIPFTLHGVLDALTRFGMPWFSPFSSRELNVDLVPEFSWIPLLAMLGLSIWLWRGLRMKNASRWGLVGVWAIYLGSAGVLKHVARAKAVEAGFGRATILPSNGKLWEWWWIDDDPNRSDYRRYICDTWTGRHRLAERYARPASEGPIGCSLRSPEIQRFIRDERWPVARVQPSRNGWLIEWGALAFSLRGDVRAYWQVEITGDQHVADVRRIFKFLARGDRGPSVALA